MAQHLNLGGVKSSEFSQNFKFKNPANTRCFMLSLNMDCIAVKPALNMVEVRMKKMACGGNATASCAQNEFKKNYKATTLQLPE